MKIFSFLILVFVCFSASQAQTIRRVNNNPGITGVNVYTTAQAAHNAASANDILIIEPSATSYGNLTVVKPLKIYGNGYFLTTNTELKVDPRSSILGLVTFSTGSNGSLLSGVEVNGTFSGGDLRGLIISASDITITRCKVFYILDIATTTNNLSNILISGNYVGNDSYSGPSFSCSTTTGTISNVTITNNIMHTISAVANPQIQNWVVRNNTFAFFSTASVNLVNSVFENNFFAASLATVNFTNVTFSNNVSFGNTFSGGIGNQNNVTSVGQFIGGGAGVSQDEQYQLSAGSPLKTAGSGGIEVGAYGGPTPYIVSGIPAIPSIVNMTNTATGSSSAPISVTITVKSNN